MSLSLTNSREASGKIHLKGFFMFLLRLADVCLENIAAHKFNLIFLCVPPVQCPLPSSSQQEKLFLFFRGFHFESFIQPHFKF